MNLIDISIKNDHIGDLLKAASVVEEDGDLITLKSIELLIRNGELPVFRTLKTEEGKEIKIRMKSSYFAALSCSILGYFTCVNVDQDHYKLVDPKKVDPKFTVSEAFKDFKTLQPLLKEKDRIEKIVLNSEKKELIENRKKNHKIIEGKL